MLTETLHPSHAQSEPQSDADPTDPPPAPPSTSDSDDLLESFLHWQGSLFDFARECGLTIAQLLAWWKSDDTQAAVKALEELTDARRILLARLHAPAAIETAAEVAQSPAVKPPERRRAAALVLRHAAFRAERRKPSVPSGASFQRQGAAENEPATHEPPESTLREHHPAAPHADRPNEFNAGPELAAALDCESSTPTCGEVPNQVAVLCNSA